jgi:hypothetical protein
MKQEGEPLTEEKRLTEIIPDVFEAISAKTTRNDKLQLNYVLEVTI